MMLSIKHLMQPYDSSSLKLAVFSVRASPNNATDTKVVWSYSYNGMKVPANCSSLRPTVRHRRKGGSVIVVDSTYVFKPLFGDFVPGISGSMTWTTNPTIAHAIVALTTSRATTAAKAAEISQRRAMVAVPPLSYGRAAGLDNFSPS